MLVHTCHSYVCVRERKFLPVLLWAIEEHVLFSHVTPSAFAMPRVNTAWRCQIQLPNQIEERERAWLFKPHSYQFNNSNNLFAITILRFVNLNISWLRKLSFSYIHNHNIFPAPSLLRASDAGRVGRSGAQKARWRRWIPDSEFHQRLINTKHFITREVCRNKGQ